MDILIRGLEKADVVGIEYQATRARLSRNEYLRRELRKLAGREAQPATLQEIAASVQLTEDLLNQDVMGKAW